MKDSNGDRAIVVLEGGFPPAIFRKPRCTKSPMSRANSPSAVAGTRKSNRPRPGGGGNSGGFAQNPANRVDRASARSHPCRRGRIYTTRRATRQKSAPPWPEAIREALSQPLNSCDESAQPIEHDGGEGRAIRAGRDVWLRDKSSPPRFARRGAGPQRIAGQGAFGGEGDVDLGDSGSEKSSEEYQTWRRRSRNRWPRSARRWKARAQKAL